MAGVMIVLYACVSHQSLLIVTNIMITDATQNTIPELLLVSISNFCSSFAVDNQTFQWQLSLSAFTVILRNTRVLEGLFKESPLILYGQMRM